MRTTLTLDPDVARMLEEEAHRQRKPFKQVVNEAIRKGLSGRSASGARKRVKIRPHRTSLMPGVDTAGLNKLADELEDEAIMRKVRGRR